MAYKKKRCVCRKRKTPKRKSYARKVKKAPLRRSIRRVVQGMAEKKSAQVYVATRSILGAGDTASAANFDASIRQVGPGDAGFGAIPTSQNAQQNGRIGNKIKIISCVLKGTVHATPYNVTTNPQPLPMYVKMTLFYNKESPNFVPSPATDADIFQLGNGAAGFTNTQTDLWAPYNTDMYRILATKTMKIGWAGNTASGALPTYANIANNDFKLSVPYSWNIAKYMPRNVRYNDNTTIPTSRHTWLMVQAVYANSVVVGNGIVPAAFSMMQSMRYTDL